MLTTLAAQELASASPARAEPDCAAKREQFAAAHARLPAYSIDFKAVAVSLDEKIEAQLREQPSLWSSVGTYRDAVTGRDLPIIGGGTILVDEQVNVCRTTWRTIGPPSSQRSRFREFRSRTEWIEPYNVAEESQAFFRTYKPATPEQAASLRKSERMPTCDAWAPMSYASMAHHVIENFSAASDLQCVGDGELTILSTEKLGVTAWIGPKGELVGVRLALVGGMQARYEFAGSIGDDIFPAKHPATLHSYLEKEYSGTPVIPPRLVSLEVYENQTSLKADERQLLTPHTHGVRLVEPPLQPARLRSNAGPLAVSGSWFRLGGVLVAIALLAALVTLAVRRARSNRTKA